MKKVLIFCSKTFIVILNRQRFGSVSGGISALSENIQRKDRIMKNFFRKYYVIEITPLKFHKFYHFVLTPVNILMTGYMLISMILHPENADAITIVYDLALLACLVLTFIGCFKLRKYAWAAIMAGFALELVYDFAYLVILSGLGANALLFAFSQILWRIVFIILMGIYYIKRQPLFFDPIPYDHVPKELRPDDKKKGK